MKIRVIVATVIAGLMLICPFASSAQNSEIVIPKYGTTKKLSPSAFLFFKAFVTDIQASPYYGAWRRGWPEYKGWTVYRNAILSGSVPAPPTFVSGFGQSLVDAGQMYLGSP
jgi:hypothetical protein